MVKFSVVTIIVLAACLLCLSVCQIQGVGFHLDPVQIIISGVVVDADNLPLSGVEMSVAEIRHEPGSFDSETSWRKVTVDGEFKVECYDCYSIDLTFTAPGMFPKRLFFELTSDELAVLTSGRVDKDFAIVRKGLNVTLEPSGETVHLLRTALNLDSTEEGPRRVLTSRRRQVKTGFFGNVSAKRASANADSDIAMIALLANSEQFASFVKGVEENATKNLQAVDAFLQFSGVASGVIPIKVEAATLNKAYHQMRQAPAEGYQDHLELSFANDGDKFYGDQFFYCQLGGLYGKGRVSLMRWRPFRDGQMLLEVGVEILFNQTGGRNLNDPEYAY